MRNPAPATEATALPVRRAEPLGGRSRSPCWRRARVQIANQDRGLQACLKNEEADAVGYKHPPREHQFRPGQSGNPSGRPKGARNFKSELREELSELVTVRDGEREIQVSKQRALIKSLVAAAIDGNQRAAASVLAMCVRMLADAEDDDGDRGRGSAKSWRRSPSAKNAQRQLEQKS